MQLFPATITSKLGASASAVGLHWPLIVAGLKEFGIDSALAEVAAAATVAVEVGLAFRPIKEKRADALRQPELWESQQRYFPSGFYGRGFIQLTWRDNYQRAGARLKIALLSNPDLALEPKTAGRLLGLYFFENGVADAAECRDWLAVRHLVNGGHKNWDTFKGYVNDLVEVIGA